MPHSRASLGGAYLPLGVLRQQQSFKVNARLLERLFSGFAQRHVRIAVRRSNF